MNPLARHAFRACGCLGLALAILLAMPLVTFLGLSAWVMAGIILAAVSSFFGLAMLTKIVTGEERLTFYHHEIAVMVVAVTLPWLLHQPVLPYLDVAVLGLGMFLVSGRLGCLLVGCCHGIPHRWGVRYPTGHAGIPSYYAGTRLFPVQALESVWVLGIVVVGGALVLEGRPPGATLAWYIVAYGVGRFAFEFLRGDPGRLYSWGFSEAQWTSVVLVLVVVWAEMFGLLPFQAWHQGAAAGLIAAVTAIAASRRFRGSARHQLLQPRHIREVAEILDLLPNNGDASSVDIGMRSTSLGVRISASGTTATTDHLYHYALSWPGRALLEGDARKLALLILQLKHPSVPYELVQGNRGVFHLLVRAPADAEPQATAIATAQRPQTTA